MTNNSIVLEMLGAETLITLIFIMWLIVGVVLFEGVTAKDVKKYLKPIFAFFVRVGKSIAKGTKVAWKWTVSFFQPATKKAKPVRKVEPIKVVKQPTVAKAEKKPAPVKVEKKPEPVKVVAAKPVAEPTVTVVKAEDVTQDVV